MEKFLKGKKTYIGIIVLALGAFGVSDLLPEKDVAVLVDSALQIIGLVVAVYGRYVAKK